MMRQAGGTHPCWCVLIDRDGDMNPCRVPVESADVPFCGDCEDRHPTFLHEGVTVTTREVLAEVWV